MKLECYPVLCRKGACQCMKYRKMSRNILIAWMVVGAIAILAVAVGHPALQLGVKKLVYVFMAGGIAVGFVRMILQEKAEEEETSARPNPYQKLRWGITAAYCIAGMILLLVLGYTVDHPEVHLPYGAILIVFVLVGVVVLGLDFYLKNKKLK